MGTKTVDSNLKVLGSLYLKKPNDTITNRGAIVRSGSLSSGRTYLDLACIVDSKIQGGVELTFGDERTMMLVPYKVNNIQFVHLGSRVSPFTYIYCEHFIVPNGTSSQFLKADGTLDGNAYALHTDLNSVKNNAWKLDEANAEVSTVVVTLQGDMGIFAAMDKAGINYQTSRNIYVDMSEADSTITDIFAGYENLPVGIRYHIFFGNTKHDCKINWNDSKVESNIVPSLGITPAYPTAKCEFMRVTEEWTYADWEAKVENVNFSIDTGTASESDNSTLMNYMDNNKIAYTKTTNGALVNITALLAALTGGK